MNRSESIVQCQVAQIWMMEFILTRDVLAGYVYVCYEKNDLERATELVVGSRRITGPRSVFV